MKLEQFSVTNYRSITTAHKIDLQELTVLVGKNNEGKSNLLTALDVAMQAIINHGRVAATGIRRTRRKGYDWTRDFPLQLQGRKSGLESLFRLNFRLNENEKNELHSLTGIRGNEEIPILVRIGKDNRPKVEVPKRGASSYNKKSEQITDFISQKISFNYIPAIRTEDMAKDALSEAIFNELQMLDYDEEYASAQMRIENMEREVLERISSNLVDPLRVFLPSISDVSIVREFDFPHRRYRSDFDVILDDGLATSIRYKGDGIKSLVALAILQDKKSTGDASVIAIEEPESHLHSGAIHSLVEVINKIAENNQVILTTHNPLFVQQNRISSNILVDNGTARQAKSISEIRRILGVLPSDNLQNARFVLVVEGETDKNSLEKILPYYDESIKNALRNNTLVIKPLRGSGNLLHELQDLSNSLCQYIVLMDNDVAGYEISERAIDMGLLKENNIRYTTCIGCKESEFEDCLAPSIYSEKLMKDFGLNINVKEFKSNKKWSDRMELVSIKQGLRWTDSLKAKVKNAVSDSIPRDAGDITDVLIKEKASFIKGLADIINSMINNDIADKA